LTSAFDKIAGTKKFASECFFLQANTFFAVKRFFAGNAFSKKIALDGCLLS
jgi:hypothetical protein